MFLLLIAGTITITITFVVGGNARAKSLAHLDAEQRLLAAPADLIDGAHVRVEGTVEMIDRLIAPVTRADCVAFHLRTQVAANWKTSFEMRSFVLRTEHGPIVVDRQADAALAIRAVQMSGQLVDPQYLPTEGGLRKPATCAETTVTPGMRVWIAGIVTSEPAPPTSELGFRDTNKIIRLGATPEHPLSIGDLP